MSIKFYAESFPVLSQSTRQQSQWLKEGVLPLVADRKQARKAGRTELALDSCGHQFCSSVPMSVALSLEIQVDPSLGKDASTQIPTAESQKETLFSLNRNVEVNVCLLQTWQAQQRNARVMPSQRRTLERKGLGDWHSGVT